MSGKRARAERRARAGGASLTLSKGEKRERSGRQAAAIPTDPEKRAGLLDALMFETQPTLDWFVRTVIPGETGKVALPSDVAAVRVSLLPGARRGDRPRRVRAFLAADGLEAVKRQCEREFPVASPMRN